MATIIKRFESKMKLPKLKENGHHQGLSSHMPGHTTPQQQDVEHNSNKIFWNWKAAQCFLALAWPEAILMDRTRQVLICVVLQPIMLMDRTRPVLICVVLQPILLMDRTRQVLICVVLQPTMLMDRTRPVLICVVCCTLMNIFFYAL